MNRIRLLALPATFTVSPRLYVIQAYFFIAALVVYSGWSAPFPAQPGVIEALIALLLMGFVTLPLGIVVISGGFHAYREQQRPPVWLHTGFFVLLWGQLFNGAVVHGWMLTDLVRDLIPFIYLCMPIMLLPVMNSRELPWATVLPGILSVSGVLLASRFFMEVGIWPWELGSRHYFDNFLYLPYDPSVSFAAVYLPLMAIHCLQPSRPFSWLISLLMLAGGGLALGSLMAAAQRAPVGLAVTCFLIYFFVSYRSWGRMLVMLCLMVMISFIAQEQIVSSLELLTAKQEEVGTNGKTEELAAVFVEISRSWQALIAGIGWGGLFDNPIYASEISFTHSAMTFFLLKGGLSGFIFLLLYFLWIGKRWFGHLILNNLPLKLASAVPISIGLFFQPSYKTLTYGIVLTLICVHWSDRIQLKKGDPNEGKSSGVSP